MGGESPHLPVAAVLLAAGGSERFGGDLPKQLAVFRGVPLVRLAALAALAADVSEVLVVTGYRAEEVEAALADLDLTVVRNPDWEGGQSTSVKAGLARVSPASRGALFLTCDQPLLSTEVLDRLLAAYRATGGSIVLPVYGPRRGSPVLFDRTLFGELSRITGDTGGRQVVRRHPDDVVEVPLESEAPLVDVDTAEELQSHES
jgi:molybdenum cofactor cytidylyltransferase